MSSLVHWVELLLGRNCILELILGLIIWRMNGFIEDNILQPRFEFLLRGGLMKGLLDILVSLFFSLKRLLNRSELIMNFTGVRDPILTDHFCKHRLHDPTPLNDFYC